MGIVEIFTKKNLEILELLSKYRLHIRDIAKRVDCSPAKVHSTIQLFKEHGIVIEIEFKNKKVIKLNRDSLLLKKILSLLQQDRPEGEEDETIGLFDAVNPLDYRYYGRNKELVQRLGRYLSEEAFVKYQLNVELALVKVLAKNKVCSNSAVVEVAKAIKKVRAQDVYREEDKIKHNIRALANEIRKHVSDEVKPYVHFTTTSFDIFDTATALRFKKAAEDVVIPSMLNLEKTLIKIAMRERNTLQIGRTHGQHAEPITFGFTISSYVSRLGSRILAVKRASQNLRGKISGAVGAYNALSIFFKDPEEFEADILNELGLRPASQSSQIVEAEFLTDYMHAIVSGFGVLGNIADDLRNLQRSEINEIAEEFSKKQVGSSTMPHKRNPISFENIKSMWKEFMPRINTVYMDQISEHQRDLTNSASQRFLAELVTAFVICVERLDNVLQKLVVDNESLKKNFDMNKKMIAAEPAYILLAAHNHPDAHEYIRELTVKAQKKKKSFSELFFKDKKAQEYIKKFTKSQIEIIKSPESYTGIASKKVVNVCNFWKKMLKI